MQNKTNNYVKLITKLYYSISNNNKKTYYVIKKRNKKVKKVVKKFNTLKQVYSKLYKNYNCTMQQLNLIQLVCSTNCYKQTTYAYSVKQRSLIKQAIASM